MAGISMNGEKIVSVLVADDDPLQLIHLISLTGKLRPEWKIVARATNSQEIIDGIYEQSPDLCLLDIEMQGATGIDIVSRVPGGIPVVFVTGYASYAAEAFDCSAIDFVTKPLREDRLEAAFRKVEGALAVGGAARKPHLAHNSPRIIRFLKGRELVLTQLADVRYFQAQHKYTRVVLADQEGLMRLNISTVRKYLDSSQFWQVHRSYLVNAHHVLSSQKDGMNRISLRVRDREERVIVAKPYEHLFSRDGFA